MDQICFWQCQKVSSKYTVFHHYTRSYGSVVMSSRNWDRREVQFHWLAKWLCMDRRRKCLVSTLESFTLVAHVPFILFSQKQNHRSICNRTRWSLSCFTWRHSCSVCSGKSENILNHQTNSIKYFMKRCFAHEGTGGDNLIFLIHMGFINILADVLAAELSDGFSGFWDIGKPGITSNNKSQKSLNFLMVWFCLLSS